MPDDKKGSAELELIDIYEKPDKIYTRSFTGFYRNLRIMGGGLLFLMFFGTAWINLGGQQAMLFDLPERKFHIFGAIFWPQDFILLSWMLIISAFALFAVTVFAGRVWCGYTCPQSVFTWVFMWAEKVTEGDRNKRMKGDKGSLSANLFMRKLAKHSIWLGVSLATAITFVGYFTPIRELIPAIFSWDVGSWGLFWIGFFTLATYGNAGFLREMVCLHMCPYARFQSVMFDNNTLVVAYDYNRGENRGSRKKSADPKEEGLGDCIDCSVCVQVCPTGIDIRNGLQYSCITCAACIDACDTIMDKMGYEKGLIRYTTENELEGTKTRFLRPRMVGYAAALIIMLGMFFYTLNSRTSFELDILRDRNQLFRTNASGEIENVYTIKLVNKEEKPHQMTISVNGIAGLKANSPMTFTVNAGEVASHIVRLALPAGIDTKGSKEIEFSISSEDESLPITSVSSRFITPIE